jgi:transcriptional regulator with XRE-family HTH domain
MKPETAHLIQTLKTAMRVLGFTNREVEKRLGVSGGYLTRLFSGTMELRFEHVVDIARAIGLEPAEVFHLAYPQPRNPPTEAAQRLRDAIEGAESIPAPPKPAERPAEAEPSVSGVLEAELQKMMARTFRKFFEDLAKTGTE